MLQMRNMCMGLFVAFGVGWNLEGWLYGPTNTGDLSFSAAVRMFAIWSMWACFGSS